MPAISSNSRTKIDLNEQSSDSSRKKRAPTTATTQLFLKESSVDQQFPLSKRAEESTLEIKPELTSASSETSPSSLLFFNKGKKSQEKPKASESDSSKSSTKPSPRRKRPRI